MLGFSELLSRKSNDKDLEQVQHYSDEIYNASKKVYRLLENLLYWSRIQTGLISVKAENLPLNDIVESNIGLFINSIKEKDLTIHNFLSKEEIFAEY